MYPTHYTGGDADVDNGHRNDERRTTLTRRRSSPSWTRCAWHTVFTFRYWNRFNFDMHPMIYRTILALVSEFRHVVCSLCSWDCVPIQQEMLQYGTIHTPLYTDANIRSGLRMNKCRIRTWLTCVRHVWPFYSSCLFRLSLGAVERNSHRTYCRALSFDRLQATLRDRDKWAQQAHTQTTGDGHNGTASDILVCVMNLRWLLAIAFGSIVIPGCQFV